MVQMPSYRPLREDEIAGLTPHRQIAYVHGARAAGDIATATRALQVLAWSYENIVRGMVAKKVPAHRVDDATDHCVAELARAIVNNPPGAVNEAHTRGWMASVVRNQITTWWRKNGKHEHPISLDKLADPDSDARPWEVASTERGYDAAGYLQIIDRVYRQLNEQHQRIVTLRVFEDRPSDEVADILLAERGGTLKPNTIDQVASRFRRACQAASD